MPAFHRNIVSLSITPVMKKLTALLFAIMLCTAMGQAQNLNRFFRKYAKNKQVEYTNVNTGKFFSSILSGISVDTGGELPILNGLKILTLTEDSTNLKLTSKFAGDLHKIIDKGKFDTIFSTRSKTNKTYIYKRLKSRGKADVMIVTKNGLKTNIVWFNGKITQNFIDNILNSTTNDSE